MKREDPVSRAFVSAMTRLFPTGEGRVMCALSGGADSVALLHLLDRYRAGSLRRFFLCAVHVHHGIRREQADRDEDFCRALCERWQIPFRARHVDGPAYAASHRMGMEESARLLRYEALRTCGKELGVSTIAVAHNATDQAETVLFHLTRGSGLDGLCGMAEQSGDLIRPLLAVEKEQILSYCEENALPFVHDESNDDQRYTRNRLRHSVLPVLKQINPRFSQGAASAALLLQSDRAYLEEQAARYHLDMGRNTLASLPDALLSRVLRREVAAFLPGAPTLSAEQCRRGMAAIRALPRTVRLTLPSGGELLCDRDSLILRKAGKQGDSPLPEPLALTEGWQSFDGDRSMILMRRGILTEHDRQKIDSFRNIYNLSNTFTRNSATMKEVMTVRVRRAGDRYYDGRHTRSVRKLLQTLPLPACLRARYPLFCDGDEIRWIPGFASCPDAEASTAESVTIICFFHKRRPVSSPHPSENFGEKG